MRKIEHSNAFVRHAVRLALVSAGFVLPAQMSFAQEAAGQEGSGQELDEVVVTGFRGSLNTALSQKRSETASHRRDRIRRHRQVPRQQPRGIDAAHPGVALSRGDGGEGKNISVRGLGPTFTRVRINGMEGAAQTGSSDIYGAGNNGRSFDFNVFPTEIFSQLAVRKTIVRRHRRRLSRRDGRPARAAPARSTPTTPSSRSRVAAYSTTSPKTWIRASPLLFSKKFFDGTFGMLLSGAFQERHTREVGYSAVDILSANTNANNVNPTGRRRSCCRSARRSAGRPRRDQSRAESGDLGRNRPGSPRQSATNCSAVPSLDNPATPLVNEGDNPRTSDLNSTSKSSICAVTTRPRFQAAAHSSRVCPAT